MAKYPEHEKLQDVKEKSQFLGEFLEWLRGDNYELCDVVRQENSSGQEYVTYVPNRRSIERLLAEFLDINLEKMEEEKRAMLEEIRILNDSRIKLEEARDGRENDQSRVAREG